MNYTPLLIFLTSFIISFFAIPSIIKVAKEKMLFDKPTEKRKIHTKSIPNLGGIAIFLGFYFSILIFRILCESMELSVLCAASVLLFFVALKDDLISTAPIIRLFYQFFIAFIIVVVGQVYFSHLPFSEYDGLLLRFTNILFSVVFIVTVINAFNFIDGVDGLSGSIGIFALLVFAFVFHLYGESTYALIALALAGSTLGFLIFNWNPAKIFMGDIGSMLLGVFLAVFAIKLCNLEPLRLGLIPIKNPTTLAIALLIIPLMDLITVIIIRVSLKESPFCADKRHTHHRLLELGLSQKSVTLLLVGFNLLMVLIAVGSGFILDGFYSMIIIILFAIAFETMLFLSNKKKGSTS
jgi:UDP-GlcNAc:undecaprenyl-phosphate/decaprenyl-phosphate GlcNAc-1-phosphate transferase